MNDKAALEQLQLINELNKEEKGILLKLIETFVSRKRFKDYLQNGDFRGKIGQKQQEINRGRQQKGKNLP